MAHPWFRTRQPMGADPEHGSLKRVLGPWSVMLLGIGCTIGAGIFVMPGEVAAHHAGPAVILSFLLAAIASACAALCYSELAAMIPVSGSAYSYAYATLGEFVAWIIGWDLLLEYGLANAAVAAGWGGYLDQILRPMGWGLPAAWWHAPGQAIAGTSEVGIVNAPAALGILLVTGLLCLGIRESARVNGILVATKIAVLLLFIALCVPHVNPSHYTPFFLPEKGWGGVVTGAAVVFFLFIGFDAVSTVAEETRNPRFDMPFGILVGLTVVTALYMGVASVLTGVLPLDQLAVSEPLAAALRATQHPRAAVLLSGVAVVGIASMLVVGSIGQTRILAVMARDGLMPGWMARIHPKLGTPVLSTLALGVVTAGLAACFPLDALADLVSIGTLSAFVVVMAGVLVLRYREPDRPRAFRTPWVPALPLAGIAINLYLMTGLAVAVWIRFLVWFGLGVACYALWGHASATRTLDRMPRQSKQPSV